MYTTYFTIYNIQYVFITDNIIIDDINNYIRPMSKMEDRENNKKYKYICIYITYNIYV